MLTSSEKVTLNLRFHDQRLGLPEYLAGEQHEAYFFFHASLLACASSGSALNLDLSSIHDIMGNSLPTNAALQVIAGPSTAISDPLFDQPIAASSILIRKGNAKVTGGSLRVYGGTSSLAENEYQVMINLGSSSASQVRVRHHLEQCQSTYTTASVQVISADGSIQGIQPLCGVNSVDSILKIKPNSITYLLISKTYSPSAQAPCTYGSFQISQEQYVLDEFEFVTTN